MRVFTFILMILILFIGIAFASLNASETSVNYLIGSKEMPLVAIMFFNLVLGIIVGVLFMFWQVLKLKTQIISLKAKLKQTEELLNKTRV